MLYRYFKTYYKERVLGVRILNRFNYFQPYLGERLWYKNKLCKTSFWNFRNYVSFYSLPMFHCWFVISSSMNKLVNDNDLFISYSSFKLSTLTGHFVLKVSSTFSFVHNRPNRFYNFLFIFKKITKFIHINFIQ